VGPRPALKAKVLPPSLLVQMAPWKIPLSTIFVASRGRVAYLMRPVGAATMTMPSLATLTEGSLAMRSASTRTGFAKVRFSSVGALAVPAAPGSGACTQPAIAAPARRRERRTARMAHTTQGSGVASRSLGPRSSLANAMWPPPMASLTTT
jgi:hypothetical protein